MDTQQPSFQEQDTVQPSSNDSSLPPQSNQNLWKTLSIVFGLLSVGLLVGIIYLITSGGSVLYKINPELSPSMEPSSEPSPIVLSTPSPLASPTTLSNTTNWKTYSTSTYSLKYPADVSPNAAEGSTVILGKIGPTQAQDTELYDGFSIIVQPREVATSAEQYAKNKVSQSTESGVAEVIKPLQPYSTSKYKGWTFTTRGLGEYQYIVLQGPEGMLMDITLLVSDPTNAGFAETTSAIINSIEFK